MFMHSQETTEKRRSAIDVLYARTSRLPLTPATRYVLRYCKINCYTAGGVVQYYTHNVFGRRPINIVTLRKLEKKNI